MAKKVQQPDFEEVSAEKHVQEIMGPAQPRSTNELTEQQIAAQTAPVIVEPDQPKVEPEASVAEAGEPVEQPASPVETPPEDIETIHMADMPADEQALPGLTTDVENPQTDRAVDDILRHDADAVLPESSEQNDAVVMKASLGEKLRNALRNWWQTPWKRYGTLAAVIVIIGAATYVAPVRAFVLNLVGVRSSMIVNVFDGATNLPLQNAVVTAGGATAKTDAEGYLKLTGIRVGTQEVRISKQAFADVKKQVYFGMRITELDDVTLAPTGTQLTYVFTDYLSGKPVADVMVSSGEATAKSDKKGKATITVQPSDESEVTVAARKEGYRTANVSSKASSGANAYKMVPSAQAVFVSKTSGKYDVYKMYIDGQDRRVLLAGTGLETQAIVALPSPKGDVVVVASTRDDKRNKDGYLLTALNLVDTESGSATNIEYAEQITLLGWRGDTIIYRLTVAGASAANANRQKIIAYDTVANKRFQLANANYFNGEQLVGNTVYYAVSSTDPAAKQSFARVNVDGTNKKTLYSGDVWSLVRTDYGKMRLQTPSKWYDYTIGATSLSESTPLAEYNSRFYVDSPDTKLSVRVDSRDADGVLTLRTLSTSSEKALTTRRDMQAPVYWLNDKTIVYRVSGPREVADYVVSIDGGTSKKLAEVTLNSIR